MCFQPGRPSPGSPWVTHGDVPGATEDPKSLLFEVGRDVFVVQVPWTG